MTQIGTRLVSFLGRRADLARIGPNHFAFFVAENPDGIRSAADAMAHLERLIAQCDTSLSVDGISLRPNLTGGMARYPDDSETTEQLLDFAAAASALVGTRTVVSAYVPHHRTEALDRFQIEEDLKYALERDEFELHYQPVVCATDARAVGAEALIRWNHPTRGMIRPDLFIPVAESSGLISDIGLWVMDAACRQVTAWNEAGATDLAVAINLSARQFHDPELIHHVRRAIDDHRIGAHQLEIELTESSMMDDFDQSRSTFGKLRDLGVRIAIDDFGTGFASMSYLRQLPFDKLKLDREFVTNVHKRRESQAICGALVALANGLGLRALAEGTETEEEVAYLRDIGCDLFQGYYLSKPVTAPNFFAATEPARLRGLIAAASRPTLLSA